MKVWEVEIKGSEDRWGDPRTWLYHVEATDSEVATRRAKRIARREPGRLWKLHVVAVRLVCELDR